MGQTLSFPVIEKLSESGENARFSYAVADMQGWRITMEDAHAAVLDIDGEGSDSTAFFAVYDGHGGSTVAKYAGQNVHKRLVQEETYKEKNYEVALKKAFLGIDEDLQANPAHSKDPSGCTAVAALVTEDKIYVANAGDSRSVLSSKGEVKPLSFDHKPTNDVERTRICDAGGYIEYGRVNGNLALSRALGDFEFKKNLSIGPEAQMITANPDVTTHEITEEDEFLVLACDGIWDCLSSQQVVDFVRYQVSQDKDLTDIAKMICDHCLAPDTASGAGIGCDNMTILVVALLQGRTREQWYAWIKDRVEKEYGRATPSTLPPLYSPNRMMSFKTRMEAVASRNNARNTQEEDNNNPLGFLAGTGLGGFARALGSTGGFSFHPGSGIMSDNGTLMFTQDDSDEDDEEEEPVNSSTFFNQTLPLGRSESPDPTIQLKARLDEFERDLDEEGDTTMADATEEAKAKQEEKSSPQKHLPNGDAHYPVPPVQQLQPQPPGDTENPVVKAEGFLDASEDPLKGS